MAGTGGRRGRTVRRIDYLFNVAGGGRRGFLLDVPMQAVDTIIDVNLKGQIYGIKTIAPIMVRQGSSHIVNVVSLGRRVPDAGERAVLGREVAACGPSRWRPRSGSVRWEYSSPPFARTWWTRLHWRGN